MIWKRECFKKLQGWNLTLISGLPYLLITEEILKKFWIKKGESNWKNYLTYNVETATVLKLSQWRRMWTLCRGNLSVVQSITWKRKVVDYFITIFVILFELNEFSNLNPRLLAPHKFRSFRFQVFITSQNNLIRNKKAT